MWESEEVALVSRAAALASQMVHRARALVAGSEDFRDGLSLVAVRLADGRTPHPAYARVGPPVAAPDRCQLKRA